MTLLPIPGPNETDAARRKRLQPPKKLKRSDHECYDDMLSDALERQWSLAAQWARAVRDHLKLTRGLTVTLQHARDILATALEQKPMTWVSIVRCSPSTQLIETMVARLEDENSRVFIVPDAKDLLSIWGDEATVRRALNTYGQEACRRRWYTVKPATEKEIAELYPRTRQADWLPSGFIA